jgi:hypothetical protein
MSPFRQCAAIFCICELLTSAYAAPPRRSWDLAADFSASQNPSADWAFGWMSPGDDAFHPYTIPFAAYGLGLKEWRGPFLDDNGSAPPDIICNPTDTAITVSDTTWLPHQVTFHPGQNGERGVVRWISPVTGLASLEAEFEGRSGLVTSGVEIYQNSTRLFSGVVLGTGAESKIAFRTNLMVQAGDRVDFRLNYGDGDWTSDTTQISVRIGAVPQPRLTLSLLGTNSAQLSWPTTTPDYVLETVTEVPATNWLPVPNQTLIQGDNFTVTVGTTYARQLFRLRLKKDAHLASQPHAK